MEFGYWLLYVACGWYWLGASGAALVCLLWLSRREPAVPAPGVAWPDLEACLAGGARIYVTPFKVVVSSGIWSRRRVEIFRDEVAPADWARLRRRCLSAGR